MLTKKSNQTSKLRVIPIFGDLGMIVQLIRSKMIQQIYQGNTKVYWTIFIWLIQVKIEMLALLSRSIWRYNHGRHTTGILTTIWTISMVVALNSGEVIGYLLSLIPFVSPVLLINMNQVQLAELFWLDTASRSIAIWIAFFTLMQIFHVVKIYMEVGNVEDHMRRGSSWIQVFILRNKFLSEGKIQGIVEPILTALIGYFAWMQTGDFLFLVLACSSALCLSLQEFLDGSYRYFHSRF